MGVLVSSPFPPAKLLIGGTYGYLVPYQERGQEWEQRMKTCFIFLQPSNKYLSDPFA